MRGFSFANLENLFFPILKGEIFLGIFGWKLLTIKSTEFVLFYFLWGVFFWRELTDYKSARSGYKSGRSGTFLTSSISAKFGTFNFGKV
jgi:hypothetical protein